MRLQAAMDRMGMSPTDVAEGIGAATSTIYRMLDQQSPSRPQMRTLVQLAAYLGVRARWLQDGTGPIEPDDVEKALRQSRILGGEPVEEAAQKGSTLSSSPLQPTRPPLMSPRKEPSGGNTLGKASLVYEDSAEYDAGQPTEEQRLMKEIMMRLEAASLNADELAREVTKRRVDEFFDAIQRKPKP